MNNITKVVFGIPHFNDGVAFIKALNKLIEITSENLNQKLKISILVVDDGSKISEFNLIRNLPKKYKNLTIIRNSFNQGYGATVKIIEQESLKMSAHYLLLLDSELSMDTTDILEVLEMITNLESEVAICIKPSRFRNKLGLSELTGNRKRWTLVGNRIARLSFANRIQDPTNGFRCLNYKAIEIICKNENSEPGFASILQELFVLLNSNCIILQTSQTYKVRTKEMRETTFSYTVNVLWRYFYWCLKMIKFRMWRSLAKS